MISRRRFLTATAATVGGVMLPTVRALADGASQRKFIFVFNYGGWDPTRVFASEFENRNVDMERGAGLTSIGDLHFVDHEMRPSVRNFFDRYHARSLILNGLLVPSVAHQNCLHLTMTGTGNDGAADWAAILAAHGAEGRALPNLVIGGPSFPGPHGDVVTATGGSGQLESLLTGDVVDWGDQASTVPDNLSEQILDSYMQRRALAAATTASGARRQLLTATYSDALNRAVELKYLKDVVDWGAGNDLTDQITLAVSALSMGISRSVTLAYNAAWDTHTDNNENQAENFEGLFSGLLDLLDRLAVTTGTTGVPLLDDVVLVVLSEMGRTPKLNENDGKDHWPYGSAMVVGSGITGGRVVGGFDDFYYGKKIDPDTGEIFDDGIDLSVATLGATLLNLADVDHEPYLAGVPAIPGLLSG